MANEIAALCDADEWWNWWTKDFIVDYMEFYLQRKELEKTKEEINQ